MTELSQEEVRQEAVREEIIKQWPDPVWTISNPPPIGQRVLFPGDKAVWIVKGQVPVDQGFKRHDCPSCSCPTVPDFVRGWIRIEKEGQEDCSNIVWPQTLQPAPQHQETTHGNNDHIQDSPG